MSKYLLFRGECETCGFKTEMLSNRNDDVTRLLLSERTFKPALFYYDEDPMYDEVSALVKKIVVGLELDEMQKVDIFFEIFGSLCDLAPDGSEYRISEIFRCPKCESCDFGCDPTEPPKYAEAEPPKVKHEYWDSLSNDERRMLVVNRIQDRLPNLENYRGTTIPILPKWYHPNEIK
ncbi:MAG: hypothetical protein GXO69_09280 [Acidobacteria bacterium]|nr:hypothetical protein [Acidobacteriota bacterium]